MATHWIESPLGYATAHVTPPRFLARALVTIVSPEYLDLAELSLLSLEAASGLRDNHTELIFLAFEAENEGIKALASRHKARIISCVSAPDTPSPLTKKGLIYALPHLLYAERYLYFDCDILWFQSPIALLDRLDHIPDSNIIAPPKSPYRAELLERMFERIYQASPEEVSECLGFSSEERDAPFGVNSGILAGKRIAWLALHDQLTELGPKLRQFLWQNPANIFWREDGVLSLLLFRHKNCSLLASYEHINVSSVTVDILWQGGRALPVWEGTPVTALHFVGEEAKAQMRWFGPLCGFAGQEASPVQKSQMPCSLYKG